MESVNQINDDSILSPQRRRSCEESKDTKEQLQDTVSKNTRRAARLKSTENKFADVATEDSSQKILAVPQHKTPSTSTKLAVETPRRSARKSVRPPLDYDEIIEKSMLRSATKEITLNGGDCDDDAQSEQKWTAAEVGRNSRKRNRKNKRLTYKQIKIDKESDIKINIDKDKVDNENVPDEIITKQGVEGDPVKAESLVPVITSMEIQSIDKLTDKSPQIITKQNVEDDPVKAESLVPVITSMEIQSIGKLTDKSSQIITKQNVEDDPVKAESLVPLITTVEIQPIHQLTDTSPISSVAKSAVVADAEMESLGLQPLEVIELLSDPDDFDEMPSLILLEDGELCSSPEQKENALNTTFDTDEKQRESKSPIIDINQGDEGLNAELTKVILNTTFDADEQPTENQDNIVCIDIDMPNLHVSPEKNESAANESKAIKVVLTNDEDQNTTLLKWNTKTERENTPRRKRSKGFRFPTPHKNKTIFNFASQATSVAEPIGRRILQKAGSAARKDNLNVSCINPRRSKSISELNDAKLKSVSFYSPIEVVHTNDIDERWVRYNDNHVTKRRKRSISLDDNRCILSKIPRAVVLEPAKIITPRKVQTRTKLPNFAAMHKKQFDQMENLIQHVERKAERAKALTNSAAKIIDGSSSAKKLPSSNTPVADRTRPRALKKIDLSNALTRPTTVAEPEAKRLKELPKPQPVQMKSATQSFLPIRAPLKITNSLPVANPKQPFSLSTNVVKGFATSIAAVGIKKKETVENKMNDRRQRHVDMFKGRPNTKRANNENKGDFIRGVRLNRRFELQMQHRRHIDDN